MHLILEITVVFLEDKSAPPDWQVPVTIGRDIGSALEFLHTAYHQPVIRVESFRTGSGW